MNNYERTKELRDKALRFFQDAIEEMQDRVTELEQSDEPVDSQSVANYLRILMQIVVRAEVQITADQEEIDELTEMVSTPMESQSSH